MIITNFKIFEKEEIFFPYKGCRLLFVGQLNLNKGEQEEIPYAEKKFLFTVGKTYSIIQVDNNWFMLVDDLDECVWFTSKYQWFTNDKSFEDYKYRKNTEKFGL